MNSTIAENNRTKSLGLQSVDYKKSEIAFHTIAQIRVSLVSSYHSHSRDGGDRLHVLAVGHAGFADDPVLQDRLHVVADLAALGGAVGGMLAPE